MFNRLRGQARIAAFLLMLTACGAATPSADNPPPAATPSADSPPTAAQPECPQAVTSPWPGITIEFPPQPCQYSLAEAAQGITFRYAIVVTEPVDPLFVGPQDAGACGQPGASGLYPFVSIAGGEHYYGINDIGLCPGSMMTDVTPEPFMPRAGRYEESFAWNGLNWAGPSDTGQPYGQPFPPGTYAFNVRIGVMDEARPWIAVMQITGSLTFTLTQ